MRHLAPTIVALLLSMPLALAQGLPYGVDRSLLSLPKPPAVGSETEAREHAYLKQLQDSRTEAQCEAARAQSFKKLPAHFFAGGVLLPASAQEAAQPLVNALIQLSMRVTEPIQKDAQYARSRPFVRFDDLNPCVEKPHTLSYPSSHATTGMLLALALGDLTPARAPALLQLGLAIGQNRLIGGAHFPSDVAAGQELGRQLWKQVAVSPFYRQQAREIRAQLIR